MTRLLALLLALLAVAAAPVSAAPAAAPPPGPVILVSLDGFRADYLRRGATPTLARLAREGAWAAEGMRPSFPSLTFPNHYTLVTGLRPDRHGIVNNAMEDPAVAENPKFSLSNVDANADRRWWDGGEPIWVTARNAGLRAATVGWPGSEAPVRGVRPQKWTHYDDDTPMALRIDQALAWLALPAEKRPQFLTLYLPEPDHTGHEAGPDSTETTARLRQVDAQIARLVAGLRRLRLLDRAQLVIVADHGMAAVRRDRVLYLDDMVAADRVRVVTSGPVSGLTPKDAEAEARLLAPHPHLRCWRKAEVPPAFHYGANPRVPPVVCLADVGSQLQTREAAAKWKSFNRGQHGYDPAAPEMRALFLAHGPAFRPGSRLPMFDNVDVQPLLARLLGVSAPIGDGSAAVFAPALAAAGAAGRDTAPVAPAPPGA